jgi:hypothetical protein
VAGRHETTWRWVRGHGSDPDQNRCDVLAKESARTVNDGRYDRGAGGVTPYPYIYGRGIARLDLKLRASLRSELFFVTPHRHTKLPNPTCSRDAAESVCL